MKITEVWELRQRFRSQHALATRGELRLLGVIAAEERRRALGEWELAGPGVLRLAGSPRTPEQAVLAACLAAGPSGFGLAPVSRMDVGLARSPDRHAVTVSRAGGASLGASTCTGPSTTRLTRCSSATSRAAIRSALSWTWRR
jgi:hypothetical protein